MSNARSVEKRGLVPQEVGTLLSSKAVKQQLLMACPRNLKPDQLIRQAVTLLQTTPGLCECTQFSVLSGIFKAAELGLQLSGPLGQAYLVPRWNGRSKCKEATFQVGYRGIMHLAFRSRLVRKFEMRTVYANDTFSVRYGTDSAIQHIPNMRDPGEAVGYYCVAELEGGVKDFDYMSKEQVVAHRQKYSPPPDGNKTDYSGWGTAFDSMAQKTVARRLGKRLPQATELQEACVTDEYGEAGMVQVSNFLEHGPSDHAPAGEAASRMDGLADRVAGKEGEAEDDLPAGESGDPMTDGLL